MKQYNDSKFCGPSKYRMQAPPRDRGKMGGGGGHEASKATDAQLLMVSPLSPDGPLPSFKNKSELNL